MFNELIESIREGGKIYRKEIKPSREFQLSNNQIRDIRLKVNLSQQKFAELIGISVATLKNWEQGRRKPTGPANILLQIVEKNPSILFKNL